MKTLVSTIVFFVITFHLCAQNFQGVATYKSHRKMNFKITEGSENSAMKKQIQEQMRKQFQQEYKLTFNAYESVYKQEEKLEAPNPAPSGIQIKVSSGSDIRYKNIKENRFANKTELFGKLFLIKDTLTNRKWELVNETKSIGNYTCFKAVFKDEITTDTFTDEGTIEKMTKPRTTTVWYTPQIPINNGPADYFGLPGLILEVNDGDLTLVCTKIVLNPNEELVIDEPTKGKVVKQTEFETIRDKKTKEMMERFEVKRGSGKGSGFVIKVGG